MERFAETVLSARGRPARPLAPAVVSGHWL